MVTGALLRNFQRQEAHLSQGRLSVGQTEALPKAELMGSSKRQSPDCSPETQMLVPSPRPHLTGIVSLSFQG